MKFHQWPAVQNEWELGYISHYSDWSTGWSAKVWYPVGADIFALRHRVLIGSGAQPPFYPPDTRCSFQGDEAGGAWSWPLTSTSLYVINTWCLKTKIVFRLSFWRFSCHGQTDTCSTIIMSVFWSVKHKIYEKGVEFIVQLSHHPCNESSAASLCVVLSISDSGAGSPECYFRPDDQLLTEFSYVFRRSSEKHCDRTLKWATVKSFPCLPYPSHGVRK